MPTLSLDAIEQRIVERNAELQALRRELEARRGRLQSLTQHKEELQAKLQQLEAEMAAVAAGAKRPRVATADSNLQGRSHLSRMWQAKSTRRRRRLHRRNP